MNLAQPLHTADVNGHPVRFFRSPLPAEDLPWHAVVDLLAVTGMLREARRGFVACVARDWGGETRSIMCAGKPLLIAPHGLAQGMMQAWKSQDDGPLFGAYCEAAKQANDVWLAELSLSPLEGVSRVLRVVKRGVAEHVH